MEKRQKIILKEAIANYIQSAEPVGSKLLVEKLNFSVSSATVRNELKTLETLGFLKQVYTSSGRIPTDEGYRWYVDFLEESDTLSPVSAVNTQLEIIAVQKVKTTLNHVAKVMSSLMDYTAIVLTPDIYKMALKVVHMVLLDLNKVLVVLLNNLGDNQEFVFNLRQRMSQDELNKVSQIITAKMEGMPFFESSDLVLRHLVNEFPNYASVFEVLNQEVERLSSFHETRESINVHGVSKMIQLPEFKNVEMTKNVLTELEENRFLTELISSHICREDGRVVIGKEFNNEKLEECSLVISPVKSRGVQAGAIGVLGPKRMKYSYVIPLVKQISDQVQHYISDRDDG
ncbi:heat-inducible transcription repressor HrcA [bacterium]|jgi:heat-inducible transcriptional repressor|nr:heat-inducible transcription repressor HrcA [bacterium]